MLVGFVFFYMSVQLFFHEENAQKGLSFWGSVMTDLNIEYKNQQLPADWGSC